MIEKKFAVILFYKYVKINEPELLHKEMFEFCEANNILGRIFISGEGINGTASGLKSDIEKYKNFLRYRSFFADLIFKEDESFSHAFSKLHIRIKKGIVNSGLENVIPGSGSKRISPEELKNLFESKEDFVIVDARNWYESKIGKFKNAVTPPMENFRDWKKAVDDLKELKDKKIVTYCTGGIRCEKASAYMAAQGFANVFQLDGGIINYTKKFPDTFWEGSIFVFDERRIVEPNSKDELKHIAECYFCGTKTSYYINCHNQDCDKILVSCHNCKTENDYCCSDECRKSPNKRKRIHG